jgi:hypothetical protein
MTIYTHANFSDWGLGIIVGERDGKLFMQFQNAGEKTLGAAPRFRALLVPVPLSNEETQRITESLSGGSRSAGLGHSSGTGGIWSKLVADLRKDATVQNWSINGYTGGTFRVADADSTGVTVHGSGITKARNIKRAEFEKVLALWNGYLAGSVGRDEMQAVSHNTTYIFSILHRVIGS